MGAVNDMSDNYERKDDAIAERIEQKLSDHIERFDRFEEEIKGRWKEQDDRFKPIEEFIQRTNTPLKIFVWLISVLGASFFGALGLKTMKFLEAHFK